MDGDTDLPPLPSELIMPLTPFLLYTSIGSLLWTAALAAGAYVLEANYRVVGNTSTGRPGSSSA